MTVQEQAKVLLAQQTKEKAEADFHAAARIIAMADVATDAQKTQLAHADSAAESFFRALGGK